MNTRTIRFLSGLGAALIFSVSLAGCRLLGNAEGSSAMTGGTSAGDTNGGESAAGSGDGSGTTASAAPVEVTYGTEDTSAAYDAASATAIVFSGSTMSIQGAGASAKGSVLTISAAGTYILSGHPDRRPGGGRRREGGHGAADTERRVHHLREQRPALREKGGQNHPDPGRRHPKHADGRRVLYLPRRRNRRTQRGGLLEKRPDHQRRRHTDRYRPVQQRHRVQGRADHHRRHHPGNGRGDGLRGKDGVAIQNGTFTIDAGTTASNPPTTPDADKGWISLDGGTYSITAANDGVQAETVLQIAAGTYTLKTGGGSANSSTDSKGEAGLAGASGAPAAAKRRPTPPAPRA